MTDGIAPYDKLLAEAVEIQAYCEITPGDNPQEIAGRIADLGVYIARSGKMLADARYHLNRKRRDETMELIERILSEKNCRQRYKTRLSTAFAGTSATWSTG
jgi:hypothetical protein